MPGRSTLLVVLVGVGCGGKAASKVTCLDGEPAIARVGPCAISSQSFRFGVSASPSAGGHHREEVVDRLLARELLAQGAQELGLPAPSRAVVEAAIQNGELRVLGTRIPRAPFVDEEAGFDYRRFQQFASSLGLTIAALTEEQQRELLAERMTERLGAGRDRWLGERCRRLLTRDGIHIEPKVLEVADDNGKVVPSSYQPCAAWPE